MIIFISLFGERSQRWIPEHKVDWNGQARPRPNAQQRASSGIAIASLTIARTDHSCLWCGVSEGSFDGLTGPLSELLRFLQIA